ncbi:MAG TPA: NAD(P)H-hydrate dehydratase [Paucimonas sp.]|nr:NAD(P)H-hydrate dehydratase [Paucimonas sp.]
MSALYSVQQIRNIETAELAGLPAGALMRRAGEAAAQAAIELLPMAEGNRILILAGPGNNGGDALEAAARLAETGYDVTVLLFSDPASQPADAREAFERVRQSTARIVEANADADGDLRHDAGWNLVIDGLFGIGLRRPLSGLLRAIVETVNRMPCPVLALDVPSGLDADTGNIVGPAGVAIEATETITFIADKPGLHTCHGRDHAGRVRVANLGIPDERFPPPTAHLNDTHCFAEHLRPRRHNSHKGSYGDVCVIGGAQGMTGAALLAARAAAFGGAGRVIAAFIDAVPPSDSMHPELMCRSAREIDLSKGAVVVGPGLGGSVAARESLRRALASPLPAVLDADALNLLAADASLQPAATRRAAPTLMTPHPLEAARLLDISAGEVQADRLAAARSLAQRFQAVVVLKGSGTVIALPDEQAFINPTGNPGLATAGSGDVLAGMCGALLAQGWPVREAALGAVWLHGLAADMLVVQGIGPIGLTAGELIPAIRRALNALVGGQI